MRLTRILPLAIFLSSHPVLFSQVIDLNGSWKFQIGDQPAWSEKNFNDSKWKSINAPAYWEDQGFHGYDGYAWYRKEFDGKKLDKNKNYYLGLGHIDDADEVYLNGILVGFKGMMRPFQKTAFNVEREYAIPQDAIDYSGTNVIAVRVLDFTLGGGIIEGNLGVFESQRNKFLLVDLQGVWSFAKERSIKKWENAMVPSFWPLARDNAHRIFWYKRTFTIKKDIPDGQLMLLVGKIDDFDEVYFNGTLIGKTNDHLPFGPSRSYLKQRGYAIPAALINKKGPNTIEIRVEDIGHDGGIYGGIIGIATRVDFDKYVGFE